MLRSHPEPLAGDAPAAAPRSELEHEIRALHGRLGALTEQVGRNDSLLRKTQDRELELLRAGSLAQLFERLIAGLRTSYQLDDVELILHDPQHEIRHLLAADGLALNATAGDKEVPEALVAAICIENAVNRARLLRSGYTDFLTGFHNRRYLHARLREELARAQRAGQSIVCLMIDLDHFKRINDQYGHLAGDAVLREVAQRIDAEMRISDTGARFGGDEFALVLSEAAITDGERVAARVLHAVRNQPVFIGKVAETITLSIGLAAATPGPGMRDYKVLAERLMAEADAALYRAKSAGRNRIATSPNLVA